MKEPGRGEGVVHSSEEWLHFLSLPPIGFAADMPWGPAEMVRNSTFLASSCLKREWMSSKNSSCSCSGGLCWPGICPVQFLLVGVFPGLQWCFLLLKM